MKDGTGVKHIPLWELRRGDWRSDDSLDPQSGVRVLAPADLFDEVIAVLAEHGLSFNTLEEVPAPQAEDGAFTVRHLFAMTEILQRAVAKIGFNYLAYTNGASLALREEFDVLRRFVRYGQAPGRAVTSVIPTTRLGNVREDGQVPVVHYLTLERDDTETAVLAHVTLFHWVVYQAVLVERLPQEGVLASSGHLFNIEDMTCYEMTRGPRERR
jgi:hypothetical protein